MMQVTITVMYIQVIYFNNLLALSIGYKFGEYYFREYNSRCKATSFLSYLIENKYDGKEVALHRIYIRENKAQLKILNLWWSIL